jgi:hypothetical protein
MVIVTLLKPMLIRVLIKVTKVIYFHQNPYISMKKPQQIPLRFIVLIAMRFGLFFLVFSLKREPVTFRQHSFFCVNVTDVSKDFSYLEVNHQLT